MAEREPAPPVAPQSTAAPAINPDPQSSAGTYIVQIPRDQIYRVPPPENAYLAERHRKPNNTRRCNNYSCRDGGRGSWCFWSLIVLGLLLLVAIFVFYFLAKPSSPIFTVQHFRVAAAAAGTSRYAVDVGVRNAGAAIGFASVGDGRAVLTYVGYSVASGKMPSFYEGPKGLVTISLDLSGVGYAGLPAEVKKSMEAKRSGGAGNITLTLTMAFQLKRRMGPIETEAGSAHVWCTVRVNTLAKGAVELLNQSCRSEL